MTPATIDRIVFAIGRFALAVTVVALGLACVAAVVR